MSEHLDNNDVWTDYLWFGGELIGQLRGSTLSYIHNDHLGRPELATNGSRAVVWRSSNDAFGGRSVTQDSIGGLNVGFPGSHQESADANSTFAPALTSFGAVKNPRSSNTALSSSFDEILAAAD